MDTNGSAEGKEDGERERSSFEVSTCACSWTSSACHQKFAPCGMSRRGAGARSQHQGRRSVSERERWDFGCAERGATRGHNAAKLEAWNGVVFGAVLS